MTYPPVLSISAEESVLRARRIAALKSKYVLGAGGRNPGADVPFTTKKLKNGKIVLGSDCIGFVLWCLGLDRYQPVDGVAIEYPFYGGWINTDSMLMDVHANRVEFTSVADVDARPGDMVVYPSIWKNGVMTRMGHIGLIVEVTKRRGEVNSHGEFMKALIVIDCAGATTRKITGKAVAIRSGALWNKPDARIVRWKRQGTDAITGMLQTWAREDHESAASEIMVSPRLGDRVLKTGMKGSDVKELQSSLNKIQPLPAITVDGDFGGQTLRALLIFQRERGLTADGIAGSKTISELKKLVS